MPTRKLRASNTEIVEVIGKPIVRQAERNARMRMSGRRRRRSPVGVRSNRPVAYLSNMHTYQTVSYE